MILQKNFKDANFPLLAGSASASSSSATILGLKVIGGKLLPGGRIGAVVEKVKKGSIADNIGRLLPGLFAQIPFLSHLYVMSDPLKRLSRKGNQPNE